MPELIRSLASRLREFVGNRRHAPRYVTHLEVGLALSVSLPNAPKGARADGHPLRLGGYTRDISATGLALVVPAIRIGGKYITGENCTLKITLRLPTGLIAAKANPVRYTPLDNEGTDKGYLIGVQITDMSDEDRARFNDYLQTLNAKR